MSRNKEYGLALNWNYVVVSLIVVGIIYLINAIPADLDIVANWGTIFWQIQDMLNNFTLKFAPLYYLAIAFVGKRVGLVNKFFVKLNIQIFIEYICLVRYRCIRKIYLFVH